MDKRKKAQAAWAVLLALLGLLAFGLPSTTPSPSPGPSPSPSPGGSGSGTGSGSGSGSGSGTGEGSGEDSGEETGDGIGDGWLPPDDDNVGDSDAPSGTPTGGGHVPGPHPDDDGETTYGDEDGLPTDPTDEYPDADDDGGVPDDQDRWPTDDPRSPTGDGDTAPVDDGGDSGTDTPGDDWGVIGDPSNLPEHTADGALSGLDDLPGDLADRFQTAASVLALPASSLFQKAKDPVTDTANDVVSYAQEHPEEAVVIVGVGALTGGAVVYTATGWTVASSSVTSSLIAVGVPQMSPQAARSRVEELRTGGGSDSSGSDSTGGSDGADLEDQNRWPEDDPRSPTSDDGDVWDDVGNADDGETAPATPGEGGYTVPSEDDVYDPVDDPPPEDDDSVDEIDLPDDWNDGFEDDENVADPDAPTGTPEGGGHTPGVFV